MTLFVRDKSFYKTVIALALPIAMQNLITTGVSMMDTLMIGALGETQLSGASLANQISFIFMVINFGIGSGASVLTAQYWGKRDTQAIRRIMAVMYRLSILLGIITMAATLLFPVQIMHIFSNEDAVIAEGVKYLQIMAFTYIMYGITLTSIGVLRSVETVKISLVVYSISFVVNVFANWVFIYGNLGAPRLEIRGAAIGTLIARITEFLIVVIFILFKEKRVRFTLKDLVRSHSGATAEFGRTAAPVILNEVLWGVGFSMISVVLGRMGSAAVAANSICQVMVQFVSVFLQGVGNAAAVIMGNTVGAGRYEDAQKRAITFIMLALLLGLFAGGLILLVKPFAIGFYNVPEATKQLAAQLINVSSVILACQSLAMVTLVGVLRGGGDVRFVLMLDVLFMWAVAVPLGFFTGLVLNWPVPLVFALMKADELLKSICSITRICRGRWIKDFTAQ